jgi:serine/threonine protein kinase
LLDDQQAIAQFQTRHRLRLVKAKQLQLSPGAALLPKDQQKALSSGVFVLKDFGVMMDSKHSQQELRCNINVLKSVRHPNIIRLLAVVESQEIMYFNFLSEWFLFG